MKITIMIALSLAIAVFSACREDEEHPYPNIDGSVGPDIDADVDLDGDADSDSESSTETETTTDFDTDSDTTELGDCEDNGDCPLGECIRVPDLPGGYWTCRLPVGGEANGPSESPDLDQCLDSADCEIDCGCYLVEEMYPGMILPHNECICSNCEVNSDCAADELCILAGVWGQKKNHCIANDCTVDGDCAWTSGGHCIPYFDACSALVDRPYAGKYCHYANDPCFTDQECGDTFCIPATSGQAHGFVCDVPQCPE